MSEKGFTVHVKPEAGGWVAEVQPGGPDVCTQGGSPVEALMRLGFTFSIDAEEHGGWQSIPTRAALTPSGDRR